MFHDFPSIVSNTEEKKNNNFFFPKRKIIIIITATTYNIEDQRELEKHTVGNKSRSDSWDKSKERPNS